MACCCGAGHWFVRAVPGADPPAAPGQVRLMLIDDLRGVFLFEGLGDEQLRDLIAVGDEVRFESGDVLFREGEAADFWWVLLAGRVGRGGRPQWEGYRCWGWEPAARRGG